MPSSREGVSVIEKRRYIDLSGAVLPNANFSHADLSYANLEGTNFSGANLTMAILVGANLRKATLRGASLAFADLTDCYLTGTDLSGANLNKAIFRNANLSMVNFRDANLRGANFGGAGELSWYDLLHGRFDETTVLPEYLDEKSLFEALERLFEGLPWESEYSGRMSALWAELNKIADTMNADSFYDMLLKMRVHQKMTSSEE